MLKVQMVQGGVVANVLLFDDGAALNGNAVALPDGSTFTPPEGATLMAQAGANIGWTLSGGTLGAPAQGNPPAPTKPQLTAYANALQWGLASGGVTITVAGTPRLWNTDPISLSLITGMAVRLTHGLSPPATVDWQFAAAFVTISAADFMLAATAVSDWILSTFVVLKAVLAAIEAGSISTFAQVDSASWPVGSP